MMDTILRTVAVERLGWAILHSVWQIAVVAVIFAVLSRWAGRRSIHLRYLTECCGLLLMLAAPAATLWLVPSSNITSGESHAEAADLIAEDISFAAGDGSETRVRPAPESTFADRAPSTREGGPALMPLPAPNDAEQRGLTDSGSLSEATHHAAAADASLPESAVRGPVRQTTSNGAAGAPWPVSIRPWLPSIVACWMIGVALLSLRPISGLYTVRRLCRSGLSPADPEIESAFRRLVERLGLHGNIRLAGSTLARVPCVVGHLRPVVLLPLASISGLSPTQVEAIIAHELAHIRRHDYLVNLGQTVIETLLFYHPAVWWMSRRVRQTREHCCDDLAVTIYPDKAAYARALLLLAEQHHTAPQPVLAASGGTLVRRIRRIAGISAEDDLKVSWLAGCVALLVLTAAMAGLWMRSPEAVADAGVPARSEDEPPKLPETYRIEIEGGRWIQFAAVEGTLNNDRGPSAWLPDGRVLDRRVPHNFTLSGEAKADRFRRTFVVKALVGSDMKLSLNADGGLSGGASREPDDGGDRTTVVQTAEFEEGVQSASVRLNVAAGPWRTIASAGGAGGVQNGVKFLPQVWSGDKPGPLIAIFPAEFDDLPDVRIVAVDRDRQLHLPQSFSTGGKVSGTELKAHFEGKFVNPTYHVQQRDYVTLEFTNVALQPGNPRPVVVKLNGTPIDTGEPLPVEALVANPPQPLRAPLDDAGSYVELVGITAYPHPTGWWNAHGAELPLDREPASMPASAAPKEDQRLLEMVWRAHLPPSAMKDGYVRIDDELGSRMTRRHPPRELPDGWVEIELIVTGSVYDYRETTDVTARTAWGDWEPLAQLPIKDQAWRQANQSTQSIEPYVVLGGTRENVEGKDDFTSVHVAFDEDPEFNYRVVLEDHSGERHPLLLTDGSNGYRAARFPIGASKANAYSLERRPFRTARFGNISLWKGIPTSAFVVPPAELRPRALARDAVPSPARVLRTFRGEIMTLPHEPILEERLAELQRRGAVLQFRPADGELIEMLHERNLSRDPEGNVPHLIRVEDTEELSYIRWRKDVPGGELYLLRNIAGLEELSLSTDAHGDDLQVLNTLSALRKIYLTAWKAGPELFGILGELQSLEELRLDTSFQVGRNGFEARHLEPLRKLTRLRHISAADMDFTDEMLEYLAGLSDLEFLYTGNSVTVTDRGLAHVADLRKLRSLVLHRIMATDAGLAFLADMPELEWLDIPSDRYTDAGMVHLASMPKLGRVTLSGCQVTDFGASILARAPALRQVALHNTRVTQAGIDALKAAHPGLEIQWNGNRPVVGAAQEKGLALRLVPELGDEAAPLTLTQAHVAALTAELKSEGPRVAERRQQHFQWFRLPDEQISVPVTEQHDDKRFALLPAQSDWIMRAYIVRPELVRAEARKSETADTWNVLIELGDSAEQLAALTGQFGGHRLAITIDDRVLAVATVRSRLEKSVVITGRWSRADAEAIARQLEPEVETREDGPSEP